MKNRNDMSEGCSCPKGMDDCSVGETADIWNIWELPQIEEFPLDKVTPELCQRICDGFTYCNVYSWSGEDKKCVIYVTFYGNEKSLADSLNSKEGLNVDKHTTIGIKSIGGNSFGCGTFDLQLDQFGEGT